MRVSPISRPLPGEQVVGVAPPLSPQVDAGWRRRLNLFTGRALGDAALTAEQQQRGGRLALAGQRVSHGVVAGLEVALEQSAEGDFFHVAPGLGLAVTGEDVVVPQALRIALADLWIYLAPPPSSPEEVPRPPLPSLPPLERLLPEIDLSPVLRPPSPLVPRSGPSGTVVGAPGPIVPRVPPAGRATAVDRPPEVPPPTLRGPVSDLLDRGTALPRVAILVLEPVEVEIRGEMDADDPCEQDPEAEAFADWQRVDGARLVLYGWPWPGLLPSEGPTWRNEIAHRIFDLEARSAPGQFHPWELKGVPIGLVGFDAGMRPQFVDGYAVVRDGGRPKRRTELVDGAGNQFLWQARLQQFAEQVAEIDFSQTTPEAAFARFRYFPPAGLLPRAAADLELGRNFVFPPGFRVDAAPIPLEQLDVAMEGSASLAPLDAATADRARILVPVPQAWYEPRLLRTETPDPAFEEALAEFVARRSEHLYRREDVRRKIEALADAATGERPRFPAPQDDPDRVEEELDEQERARFGPRVHRSELFPGLHQHLFHGAREGLTVAGSDRLFAWIRLDPANPPTEVMLQWRTSDWLHRGYWGANQINFGTDGTPSRRRVGDLPAVGQWVRLEVPADMLGIGGQTINGIAFTLFGGSALWGSAGTLHADGQATEWLIDEIPEGATTSGTADRWSWVRPDVEHDLDPPEDEYRTELRDGVRIATPLRELVEQMDAGILSDAEIGKLHELGLEDFLPYLDGRVRLADDRIDFGFLRVQADMYRLRQLMLGEAAATRLATSPALATIIKSESALTVKESLLTYLKDARLSPKVATQSTPTTTASAPAPTTSVLSTAKLSSFTQFTALPLSSIVTQPSLLSGTTQAIGPVQTITPTIGTVTPTQAFVAPTLNISPITAVSTKLPATTREVLFKSPIIGEAYDFRTVTVGERLETPPANEAKSFTVLTRYEIISGLKDLGINLDDILIPGFVKMDDGQPVYREATTRAGATVRIPVREPRPFGEVKDSLEQLILEEDDPENGDEAGFFSMGVELLDSTIAALRNVEGRIQQYRALLERCREVLEELRSLGRDADRRLKVIEDGLAEARHDVAVGRALLVEEEERVAAINQRRRKILSEHVPFLAFHRPRYAHADLEAPERALEPAFVQEPVAACLAEGVEPPAELRSMVELLREAPLRWFHDLPRLLQSLDRLDLLLGTLSNAKARADRRTAPQVLEVPLRAAGLLGSSIGRAFAAQQQVVAKHRLSTAHLDLGAFAAISWQRARTEAEQLLSLGDLIDASHGRTGVDRGATRELDDILHVATCLYARFGEVRPSIRLDWAERLSQFDTAIELRNLYSLPRWTEVDSLDRREMQALVDWLFGRMDPRQPEAVAMVSQIVLVCVLLASHAPVNQIIAGSVPKLSTTREGGSLELDVDLSRVRVGMHVLLFDQERKPVHAVVEDLAGGKAVTRVLKAASPTVVIPQGTRAQFGEEARIAAGSVLSGGTRPRTSGLAGGGGLLR